MKAKVFGALRVGPYRTFSGLYRLSIGVRTSGSGEAIDVNLDQSSAAE